MKFAIELAERAENYNEVPVGCVIADHNQKLMIQPVMLKQLQFEVHVEN